MGHLRPISILCAASKILESVALKQIQSYIADNELLDPYQSGFRKHHSTHTALALIVDDIREATDEEEVVLLAGLDLSQAFDLINIALLVEKLKMFGFSDAACQWVHSFLSNRSQVVAASTGQISQPLERKSGVPQGSLFGPTLFSLFFNDASTVLKHCKYHMYAHDLTIYCRGSFKDLHGLISKMNDDLNNLSSWCRRNGLIINPRKTQVLWFGSRGFISRLRDLPLPEVSVCGQSVPYCESVKLLGITLDSTLSWNQQCIQTSKKCFAALSRLRKCRDCLPRATRLPLIKTLVLPYLDYCAGLFLNLSAELTLKLSRCKNAALRFAVGIQKHEHITPVYRANNILPYSLRRNFLAVCLLVSILQHAEPRSLFTKFKFRPPDKTGSKRCSEYGLVIPWARTNYFKFSFAVGVSNLWNNLPENIRSCYTRPCFKKALESHYLRVFKGENTT